MVTGINTGYYGYNNQLTANSKLATNARQPYLIEQSGIYPPQFNQPQKTADTNAADGKNDGNIGFWKATGNLLKGALKFVTSPFTDEQGNFSIGKTLKSAVIAAGIAAATCIPVVGPLVVPTMLAAGITFGTIGAVKAGANIMTAETDAESEAAWQSLGGNLTAVGLSVYGAKKYASAQAGENVSVKDGVKQVFKEPKDAVVNGWNKVKNAKFGDLAHKVGIDKAINKINPAAAEAAEAAEEAGVAEEAVATEAAEAATTPKKPFFSGTRERIVNAFDNNKDKTLSELVSKIVNLGKNKFPSVTVDAVKNNPIPFGIGALYMVGRTDVKPSFYNQLTPAEQQYYDRLPDTQKQALLNQYYGV